MKYFLGEAANYSTKATIRQLFVHGSRRDMALLREYLASRYSVPQTNVIPYCNGRSALAAGLKTLVPKNSQVVVNGFTCQAVVEAVRAAGCTPVYADIEPSSLHFDIHTLAKTLQKYPGVRAIIIQNTLGLPADHRLFSFARRHQLLVIEDLAHSAGRFYASGAEMGTLGDATVLSFGKGKAIDTISGGVLILRTPGERTSGRATPGRTTAKTSLSEQTSALRSFSTPVTTKPPRLADSLRARFYPSFAAVARALTPTVFAKIWLWGLLKLHFIERSADARLDLNRRPAYWQAKLALEQFKNLPTAPLRGFRLVHDREELLDKLAAKNCFFAETWYDCPISPARNYHKWHFPESECPVATKISRQIINLPTHYPEESLAPALALIKQYEIDPIDPSAHPTHTPKPAKPTSKPRKGAK